MFHRTTDEQRPGGGRRRLFALAASVTAALAFATAAPEAAQAASVPGAPAEATAAAIGTSDIRLGRPALSGAETADTARDSVLDNAGLPGQHGGPDDLTWGGVRPHTPSLQGFLRPAPAIRR